MDKETSNKQIKCILLALAVVLLGAFAMPTFAADQPARPGSNTACVSKEESCAVSKEPTEGRSFSGVKSDKNTEHIENRDQDSWISLTKRVVLAFFLVLAFLFFGL
ncbi:MAG: hypothetical protein IKZ87_03590 [Actinomycetaceae bacterium]|nr:hypothetical protein [Actinomycetaceae bacterium]